MIGEISNPSDTYTIDCSDRAAACAAVLFLGKGKYGINGPEDEDIMGIFLFGGGPEWFEGEFGKPIEEYLADSSDKISAALHSVLIGGFADRRLFDHAVDGMRPSKRKAFRDAWHDEKRSSVNDIGARAIALADQLDARQKEARAEKRQTALRAIVAELKLTMQCNCDLDKWEPERDTGHSHVCRIHKAAKAKLASAP